MRHKLCDDRQKGCGYGAAMLTQGQTCGAQAQVQTRLPKTCTYAEVPAMIFFLGILASVALIALEVASLAWGGYVFSTLWGWYAVPIFGAPEVSIPQAISLSMIVAILTQQARNPTDNKPELIANIMAVNFLTPAYALLVGWVLL